jgi:single-strand DNA-binding protein
MYLNKAFVIGNLTKDPELKALPSGAKVATFSVATNRVWMKDGVKQETAEFHNIVVFGRQAETTAQYLRKGSSVLVEGRMQTRSWDGQDGVKRYRTEIVADRVQFGTRATGGGTPGGAVPARTTGSGEQEMPAATPEELDTIQYPEEDINPEDIPF